VVHLPTLTDLIANSYRELLTEGWTTSGDELIGSYDRDEAKLAAWKTGVFLPWATGLATCAGADQLRIETFSRGDSLLSTMNIFAELGVALLAQPGGRPYPGDIRYSGRGDWNSFRERVERDWGELLIKARQQHAKSLRGETPR
jgi:hypothetical protein